jgi:inosine-uridine nucleoside N-ribohydrolase
MAPDLVLDCDPGDDDALAILMAHRYGRLRAVTTVAGNAPVADTTRNALHVLETLGIDVPVFAGAPAPLAGGAPERPRGVHGTHGLGDAPVPEPARRARPEHAADALAELIRTQAGLTLVATGPLTNVAEVFTRWPELVAGLGRLVVMGGAVGPGNRSAVAEANVWSDPEAAAVVFDAPVPTTLVGLHVTRRVTFGLDDVDALARTPGAAPAFYAPLLRRTIAAYARATGAAQRPLHDPCAVLAATHPRLFRTERRDVRVELNGRWTRGMTVVDLRPGAPAPGDAAVDVAMDVDAAGVRRLVFDALGVAPDG